MTLEALSLTNYRGFEKLNLSFEKDVTVIAGVNGVGKSSLLRAIALLLSNTNRNLRLTRESAQKFQREDFYNNSKEATATLTIKAADSIFDVEIKSFVRRSNLTNFDLRGKTDQVNHENMLSMLFTPRRQLPSRPRKLPADQPFEPSAAFSLALKDREVGLRDFMQWFRAQERTSENNPRKQKVLNELRTVISDLMPEFTNLRIQEKPYLSLVVDKLGKPFSLHQLSDGERGLLAVVFDLTRRLAIANPESNNPITEGEAVVLIDEIELHLHPKWQRHVMRRLRDKFKNCQFIITTHSPQVIGQVKGRQLRLLSHDEAGKVFLTPITQAFGMDSSWILQNIMGVPARDYETEQQISKIYDAIDQEKYKEARSITEKIRVEIGDFPELQEAVALLDRFELLRQG